MNATAAAAALAAAPSAETFGLTAATPRLIAKLRNMDPALLADILQKPAAQLAGERVREARAALKGAA